MFKKSHRRVPTQTAPTVPRLGSLPSFSLMGLCLSFLLLLPAASDAQERYSFTASVLGGVSGSFDASPDPGFGNTNFQLGFSWVTQPNTTVGLRLGRMDFGNEQMDDITNAEMTYLTFSGEYRMTDRFYQSGIYIGVGLYNLDGNSVSSGSAVSSEALGFNVGITGDFPMTPHWSVLVELAGHWADVEDSQLFANGLVGAAFRF